MVANPTADGYPKGPCPRQNDRGIVSRVFARLSFAAGSTNFNEGFQPTLLRAPSVLMATVLITGGAGFIGGTLVRQWIAEEQPGVVNLDKLTYAGNLDSLATVIDNPRHVFVHGDIGDAALVSRLLAEHRPQAIINLAAESHVDRSI